MLVSRSTSAATSILTRVAPRIAGDATTTRTAQVVQRRLSTHPHSLHHGVETIRACNSAAHNGLQDLGLHNISLLLPSHTGGAYTFHTSPAALGVIKRKAAANNNVVHKTLGLPLQEQALGDRTMHEALGFDPSQNRELADELRDVQDILSKLVGGKKVALDLLWEVAKYVQSSNLGALSNLLHPNETWLSFFGRCLAFGSDPEKAINTAMVLLASIYNAQGMSDAQVDELFAQCDLRAELRALRELLPEGDVGVMWIPYTDNRHALTNAFGRDAEQLTEKTVKTADQTHETLQIRSDRATGHSIVTLKQHLEDMEEKARSNPDFAREVNRQERFITESFPSDKENGIAATASPDFMDRLTRQQEYHERAMNLVGFLDRVAGAKLGAPGSSVKTLPILPPAIKTQNGIYLPLRDMKMRENPLARALFHGILGPTGKVIGSLKVTTWREDGKQVQEIIPPFQR